MVYLYNENIQRMITACVRFITVEKFIHSFINSFSPQVTVRTINLSWLKYAVCLMLSFDMFTVQ